MSKKFNKNFKNFRNNNLSEYEFRIDERSICSECKRPKTGTNWCKNCNGKIFQQNFDKWTSGNEYIDKFIQKTQLEARHHYEVIEWIPYNRLRNIKYLAKGGFSTIYKAIWLDGWIISWNNEDQSWNRYTEFLTDNYKIAKENDVKSLLNENEVSGFDVVLKSLNNSSDINDSFLNELKSYLKCSNIEPIMIKIYGITQDPETSDYMIVMFLMRSGSLRSNLLIKKYNPFEKYHNLTDIAKGLSIIHKCNLVHGDFHSGNILLQISDENYVSDFGLSRPINKKINSNEIYGVIPYMAPEVLRGNPYTKAADIYSFGIIMWEFTSGVPAFNNRSHDFDLSLDIGRGLRPKIIEGTLPFYARLMKRCWDSDPSKRPTADEVFEIVSFWSDYYPRYCDMKDRVPIPNNEPITKNHPLSCYTSRKIDYSAKLNEILSREELSTKFVTDEETLLSESLENCRARSDSE